MTRRTFYSISLGMLGAIGLLAVVVMFGRALVPNAKAKSANLLIDLNRLSPGQAVLKFSASGPIWIVAANDEMIQDLKTLDALVWDPKITSAYQSANGRTYFLFSANPKSSCTLVLHPKSEPNKFFGLDHHWLGGFVDPCHDGTYDYAGRSLKATEYTYMSASWQLPNQWPATVGRQSGDLVLVGLPEPLKQR